MGNILEIKDLHATVGETPILKGINLVINPGDNSCHYGKKRFREEHFSQNYSWFMKLIKLPEGIFCLTVNLY